MTVAASEEKLPVDFIEVVASCVHDLKNSAAIVVNSADNMRSSSVDDGLSQQINAIQLEAQRINHDLMQLLGLYKIDRAKQTICPNVVDCEELLVELAAHNAGLLDARGIAFEYECDDSAEGYFDREMILGILNSAVNNAQRYADSVIRAVCGVEDGYTVLDICDDGPGYPVSVLERDDGSIGETDVRSGSTGLGLFFANRIAAMHGHRGRHGSVTLSNDGINGGARFRLWLP